MKNYLIAIICSMAMTGCSFFEQPTDVRDLDYVFNHGESVIGWLADSYAYIPDPFEMRTSTKNNYFPWVAISDECDMGIDRAEFKSYRINLGDWNASEGGFGDKWDILYKQIRHLYVFLDNVHVVSDQNYINSEEKVEGIKLEARFLIAYFHFILFEQFGPIPIIKGAIDPEAGVEEMMVYRNSVDEVVGWLDKELYDIAAALPDEQSDIRWAGRPVKASALAIRAKVLMLAASPLFNSPDNYAGLGKFYTLADNTGKRLFPQKYDASKWERAALACRDVIELPGFELHKTTEPTGDAFVDAYKSYREVFTVPGNKEVLFCRTKSDVNEYLQGIQPRQWQAGGFMAVTQKLVDAFYMSDGLDINDSPLYSEAGYTFKREDITLNKLVHDRAKIDEVFNMYQNREPRFYASVFFNGRKWESQYAEVNGVVQPVDFFLNGLSGRPNHDSPKTGYCPYKYVDTDDYKYKAKGKCPIIFRLAEIYLDYAEALNQYDPSNPDILIYLNKVRERAGLKNYQDVYPDHTSQEQIHEAIMRERQVELNFEGSRYFDTRRYLKAQKEDAGDFYGMNMQKTISEKDGFYRRTVFETRIFRPSFYLFPIPQDELDNNKNLVQNPYWE